MQNELESKLRTQNNLQTQLQSFLTTATKSPEAAPKKHVLLISRHCGGFKQTTFTIPHWISALLNPFFLTPPLTVERPERRWPTPWLIVGDG